MSRFNQWETEYLRSLHPTRRLEQFYILFELAQSYDEQERSKMHEEHLRGLVETQKRLGRVHRLNEEAAEIRKETSHDLSHVA